jgi:hypothetical protein
LGKQLELCNKEKQEYKCLLDSVYEKNVSLKKNLYLLKERSQIDCFDDQQKPTNKKNQNSYYGSNHKNRNKVEMHDDPSDFEKNDIDTEVYYLKIFEKNINKYQ